ncbi:MAG: NEL domain-containing protein [Rhabdochlamydiaceae bacterium]
MDILTQVYQRAGLPVHPLSTLLLRELDGRPQPLAQLQTWLNRLSWTAEGGARSVHPERSKAFYQMIASHLELADRDPNFRSAFWSEVKEGCTTCGDRIALSVLKLGLARDRFGAQGQSLQILYNCLKQSWIIDLLAECASRKVEVLPFFDEIEVYLAFPIQLREKLGLSLDVGEMCFFDISEVKEIDLNQAESYVRSCLSNQNRMGDYLLEQADWVAALKRMYPDMVIAIQDIQARREDATTSEEKSHALYLQMQKLLKEKTLQVIAGFS